MPVSVNPPYDYAALKDLSPSQVRALIPAASYFGGPFDWNEFHRATNDFWKTHNDDQARSLIGGTGFTGGAYGPAVAAPPVVTPPVVTPPPVFIPQNGPGAPPIPVTTHTGPAGTTTVTPDTKPPGADDPNGVTLTPAEQTARKNLVRFGSHPLLAGIFAQAAPRPGVAAPTDGTGVPQGADPALLAAVRQALAEMSAPHQAAATFSAPTITTTAAPTSSSTDSLNLSTRPLIDTKALHADAMLLNQAGDVTGDPNRHDAVKRYVEQLYRRVNGGAPANLGGDMTSTGLGSTTASASASNGIGLGARMSGGSIF